MIWTKLPRFYVNFSSTVKSFFEDESDKRTLKPVLLYTEEVVVQQNPTEILKEALFKQLIVLA